MSSSSYDIVTVRSLARRHSRRPWPARVCVLVLERTSIQDRVRGEYSDWA